MAPIRLDITVQIIRTVPASKWTKGKHSINILKHEEMATTKNTEFDFFIGGMINANNIEYIVIPNADFIDGESNDEKI